MKYLISSCLFVILYKLFWQLSFLGVYGYSKEFYSENSEKYCNFPTILHFPKDDNRTYSSIIISRSRAIGNATEELSDNDEYCRKLHVHNNKTSDHKSESPKQYDTLTQSDLVRNQYMTLPYPSVSQEDLHKEKIYYDTIYKPGLRKKPWSVSSCITFEALNHFLYKGRNTFRLAPKRYFVKL